MRSGSSPACRRAAQDQEGARRREPPPRALRKSSGTVPRVEVRSPVCEIAPQGFGGLPADRDEAFFRALAHRPHESLLEVDGGRARARPPRSRAGLRRRGTPRARGSRTCSRRRSLLRLSTSRSASPGESVRGSRRCAAREVELGGGVLRAPVEERLVSEEGSERGGSPRDRRRREPFCAQVGEVALEVVGGRLRDRLAKPGRQRLEVAPVCLDGARGEPRCRHGQEALDLRIGDASGHRPSGDVFRRRASRSGSWRGSCAE